MSSRPCTGMDGAGRGGTAVTSLGNDREAREEGAIIAIALPACLPTCCMLLFFPVFLLFFSCSFFAARRNGYTITAINSTLIGNPWHAIHVLLYAVPVNTVVLVLILIINTNY